jgi:hypothetical protein
MSAVDDLDQVIELYQRAANEFLKGNPEPHKMMFSHREDATLLNPFGSLDHGWEQVAETMERFASQVSDGEVTSFDVVVRYVTPELAYVVWVERSKAKAGGVAIRAAGYADPSTRRRHLEGSASARRLDDHGSANSVGDPRVELPLEQLPRIPVPRTLVNKVRIRHLGDPLEPGVQL